MGTLSPDHLELFDAAKSLFGGDLVAALHWLSCPLNAFGGKVPAAMVTTRLKQTRSSSLSGTWNMDFLRGLPRGC
ncbi:antitoxin Xre/MbcA/ParS toxin-binding domain-containing protein, partial [Pseudomonas savastanoi]|uniref:antitoxin Xre/MbcA/ParS toxin-binding domain-containing protein n=1 Tax=Pseudomonas savastanoi TaxID=29438 RepID=UPI001F21E10E